LTAGTFLASLVLMAQAGDLAEADMQFLIGVLFITGLKVSVVAVWRRRLWVGYAASALLLASVLLELVHFELEQPQYFAAPVAFYLLAVAHLERRRVGWALTTPLLAIGLVLLGTSLLQSVGQLGATSDERYIFGSVLFGESLLVFAWGAAQRVRLTFFSGIGTVLAAVVIMLVEPLAGTDRLLLLAIVGAVLLAAAAFLERKRNAVIIWARAWLTRLEAWD
ncbi:MAG: SCO7613 C-terminal domain-containing membrane protein, partial [Dehalococcoidia bacterium]